MNYTQTAKHVFYISEKTGRSIFDIVSENPCHYSGDELNKIAITLTESQLQNIVDRLIESGEEYSRRAKEWENEDDKFWSRYYSSLSDELFHSATMWSISKPVNL